MVGNVWEWVWDPYEERATAAPSLTGQAKERLLRGGSFLKGPQSAHLANRNKLDSNRATDQHGFRLARNHEPTPAAPPTSATVPRRGTP
jgi:formylglycine-generating enzyme required for sulfatase activity